MSFNILTGKEGASPKKPLFLVTITAPDGDVTYLTTASNYGAASITYNGHTYLARILNNDIAAIQAMSPQGYDSVPGFSLTLSDADKFIWNNHCYTHGWRGAAVELTAILFDVVANAYSTDAYRWQFICGNPQHNYSQGQTTVDVTSATNFTRLKLPSIPIQFRCPWDFPTTLAQRTAAYNDPTSIFYQCGYSADVAGGVGNLTGGGAAFTDCELVRSSPGDPSVGCMARLGNPSATSVAPDGDLAHDIAGHNTGNFGGATWMAGSQYSGRAYANGQKTFGFNQPNTGLAGVYYNFVYGTQWVQGHVLAPAGDPNSLRSEVAICVAAFGPANVLKLVVNGVEVPYNNRDVLFTWRYINQGGRNGHLNGDAIFDNKGDPHGSVCVVEFVVPAQLAAPGSVPSVQALVTGGPILTTDGSSFSYTAPNLSDGVGSPACNAAFAYLDLITWGNIQQAQIDAPSWFTSSQICALSVGYLDAQGVTRTHAQYKASFALLGNQRMTLAQVLAALRNGANLMVAPNSITGKIQCFVKQTLADQQPASIAGSNDATARASVTASGVSTNGYYAYGFDETNIEEGSFRITSPRSESIPNTVAFAFQDENNGYQQDTLTEIDPHSYAYSGNQEIAVPVPVIGPPNFDQSTRIANTQLAEALFGNPRNDPGGTLYFEFRTNHRVLHLASRLGYICGLRWQGLGIGTSAPQAIRLLSIKPDTDGEHWDVKAAWHRDEWYTFAYGQNSAPFHTNPLLDPPARPPYPWRPGVAVWGASDALFPDQNGFDFSLDTSSYPAQLTFNGAPPNNAQPSTRPPLVRLQGTTATTGGTIRPGTYLIGFSPNGTDGPVSSFCTVVVPVGTNTNTITVSGLQWQSGAAPAPVAFIGTGSLDMHLAAGGDYTTASPDTDGNPTTYTFSKYTVDGLGLPDVKFESFKVQEIGIIHGGVWGDGVGSVATNVLTFPAGAWTVNEWTGYILSLYFRPGADPQPALNIAVSSNTATTLTMASTGFLAGDVVVMRAKSDSIAARTIGCAKFVNSYSPLGLMVDEEEGRTLRIIAGTGAGQIRSIVSNTSTVFTLSEDWDITPDATSVFIILDTTEAYSYRTAKLDSSGGTSTRIAVTPANTLLEQSLLVTVSAVDVDGKASPTQYQPFREVYIPPQSLSIIPIVSATSNVTLAAMAQSVEADASGGDFTITLPAFGTWLGLDITITKMDSGGNVVTWQCSGSETVAGIGHSGTLTTVGQSVTITATQA